jgi:hypothetical protein
MAFSKTAATLQSQSLGSLVNDLAWCSMLRILSRGSDMIRTFKKTLCIPLASLAMVLTINTVAGAQWDPYPWKRVPRTADGKVDLNAPTQRTPDGKPDLSGFWMPENPVKHLLNLAADLKPEDAAPAMGAQPLQRAHRNNGQGSSRRAVCRPAFRKRTTFPTGLKVVQTETSMLFLHESRTIYRQIFMDGRSFPKDPQPTWMGYSIGHWDKDTFVVETMGQNGRPGSTRGLPGTEALRVTERFPGRSIGHMDIEVTIDDPQAYTKPWTVKLAWR